MSECPQTDELTRIRRADRAIQETDDIVRLLKKAEVCRIATAVADQPFISPRVFWYDGERIFFHMATQGRTVTNLAHNPRVCLEVDWWGPWLPADRAAGFSLAYTSVVVFGRANPVTDPQQKRRVLQGLLDKYFPDRQPGTDYRPITETEMAQTAVYAIQVDSWSGKRHRPASDGGVALKKD